MEDADRVAELCRLLDQGATEAAVQTAEAHLPFTPLEPTGRRYTQTQMLQVYVGDHFTDRYTGQRLVHPAALRMLHHMMPEQIPFHRNWKQDSCHLIFWTLTPTLDHLIPQARGGPDDANNWVTCSMKTNAAKSNWTLEELNWQLRPVNENDEWDGLSRWYLENYESKPEWAENPSLTSWYGPTVGVLKSV